MLYKKDKRVKVVKAPDAQKNVLYKLTKAIVKMAKIKNSLVGTKEEVLAKAAKMISRIQSKIAVSAFLKQIAFLWNHCA